MQIFHHPIRDLRILIIHSLYLFSVSIIFLRFLRTSLNFVTQLNYSKISMQSSNFLSCFFPALALGIHCGILIVFSKQNRWNKVKDIITLVHIIHDVRIVDDYQASQVSGDDVHGFDEVAIFIRFAML